MRRDRPCFCVVFFVPPYDSFPVALNSTSVPPLRVHHVRVFGRCVAFFLLLRFVLGRGRYSRPDRPSEHPRFLTGCVSVAPGPCTRCGGWGCVVKPHLRCYLLENQIFETIVRGGNGPCSRRRAGTFVLGSCIPLAIVVGGTVRRAATKVNYRISLSFYQGRRKSA